MDNTFTKIKVKCSGAVKYDTLFGKETAVKVIPFTNFGMLQPFNLTSYKPRADQFCNGSATRQKEILNMIISPGIVRGLKQYSGLRYLLDGFKSYVEGGYKEQFGNLADQLNKGNKFVRCIVNEPFVEDLEKSTNPLFKETPSGIFDWKYLATGGNENFSTIFLSKGAVGQEFCFYFGTGLVKSNALSVPAGKVSNLFVAKALAFDVVANETGQISGIDNIEENPDDTDRAYMEKFRFNPIIKIGSNFHIYGNWTGQKKETAQSQIQNSELLAYIQESLLAIGQTEAFKKGTYSDYLRTETECTNFMSSLAQAGAIESDFTVICNASNNTPDIQKKRMKLIEIEYTPVNCLDKVVFALEIK